MDQRSDLERGDPLFEGNVVNERDSLFSEDPIATDDFGSAPSGIVSGASSVEGFESPDDDFDEVEEHRIQVEQTRADMSETIDAIQDKLSPSTLAQQAKDTVKDATIGKAQQAVSSAGDTATGMGSSILGTVQQNPVPAALIGIGLGWLFMSGRKQSGSKSSFPSQKRYAYRDVGLDPYAGSSQEQSGSSVGQAFGQAQQTAGQVTGQVQDTAQQVMGQAQDQAGRLATTAQDQAGQLATTAQQRTQQVTSGFQHMLQENPLTVGVVGLALGAAVGLAIPETPAEDQLMGQARSTVMDKAQQTAQDTAQKVQSVAQEAVGAAKQKAQDQGLTQ